MINLYIFILGLAIGSFLNVLIDRLPKGQKITGRSKCDYCRKNLKAIDLIPVISFIIFGGKSRCCHKKLSFYYPLVEIITGIFFILITNNQITISKQISITKLQFSSIWLLNNWSLFVSWLLVIGIFCCLIVIFFADLKYQIIPDSIQIIFFIFSLLIILINIFPNYYLLATNYLLSGLVVMSPILFLWAVTKGKGMGFGDVKLAVNIGFLLGIKAGLLALYFAFITGAIIGLFLILMKKSKLKSKIAFGPFLVIGTIVMIFYQKEIFEVINKIYDF